MLHIKYMDFRKTNLFILDSWKLDIKKYLLLSNDLVPIFFLNWDGLVTLI
jgi:hypothetical protein